LLARIRKTGVHFSGNAPSLLLTGDSRLFTPIAQMLSPKAVMRAKLKAERAKAFAERKDAPQHAARLFMANVPVSPGATVLLYHPIKDELDTEPLAAALAERGCTLALPVVTRKNAPLDFRRHVPGGELRSGAHGTSHPANDAERAIPDILVVPLLGFTRAGARLGYGGGYYDRTIEMLRAERPIIAVGYGFGAQEVDALPLSPLDQKLDWIVTEREAIRA
jgi:5-formyltetrahydrofolate cyclo-ligase